MGSDTTLTLAPKIHYGGTSVEAENPSETSGVKGDGGCNR